MSAFTHDLDRPMPLGELFRQWLYVARYRVNSDDYPDVGEESHGGEILPELGAEPDWLVIAFYDWVDILLSEGRANHLNLANVPYGGEA